jgi:hypothetical protein
MRPPRSQYEVETTLISLLRLLRTEYPDVAVPSEMRNAAEPVIAHLHGLLQSFGPVDPLIVEMLGTRTLKAAA